jgi:Arc/MetJ-type ribon-helix-helix transcriptional regulator
MTIELKPEDEAFVRQRLETGAFRTAQEVIHRALVIWTSSESARVGPAQPSGQTLSEFLLESPLAGSELNLERDQDPGRTIEL